MIGRRTVERMAGAKSLCAILLAAAACAQAQTLPAKLEFEAASLKPSGPQSVSVESGGPGTRDPGRLTYGKATLRRLVCRAYGLGRQCEDRSSGPGWIDKDEYDVVATIPPGTTRPQFRQMLQNLLAERFNLVVHRETRIVPVYELVVGKNGPKLKESALPAGADPRDPSNVGRDADGGLVLEPGRPGFVLSCRASHCQTTARQQSIAIFADWLRGPADDRLVIDKTGLTKTYDMTKTYDITLEFDWHTSADVLDDGLTVSIFQALEQQLGLKLVDAKAPLDVVVVDRGDKVPAEN